MNRTFIETPMFIKKWKELGLTDENLRELQNILLNNPKTGDVIQGTGGLRKIRISLENTGKRGGGRVLYVDVEQKETIYFINVYTKNEKDDLTEDEKKAFKTVIQTLKGGLSMSSFFDDTMQSLLEAIEIDKGNLPVKKREGMPAPTFYVPDDGDQWIDNLIEIRKKENLSQEQIAEMIGSSQQSVSRFEKKTHNPSLKLFACIVHALGYDIEFVKR